MITINIDNLTLFYFSMTLVAVAFAIMVTFGKTKEEQSSKRKR